MVFFLTLHYEPVVVVIQEFAVELHVLPSEHTQVLLPGFGVAPVMPLAGANPLLESHVQTPLYADSFFGVHVPPVSLQLCSYVVEIPASNHT